MSRIKPRQPQPDFSARANQARNLQRASGGSPGVTSSSTQTQKTVTGKEAQDLTKSILGQIQNQGQKLNEEA